MDSSASRSETRLARSSSRTSLTSPIAWLSDPEVSRSEVVVAPTLASSSTACARAAALRSCTSS